MSKRREHVDIVIVGAGIIGLALAKELQHRHPHASVCILEKEERLGCHASGRNSGVLHAGLYYPPGTLKAQLCRQGALALKAYCEEQGLPYQATGKIILPTKPADDKVLDLLYERGTQNGVALEWLTNQQLHMLEPLAFSCTGRALYSPETGSFDAHAILARLGANVRIHYQSPVIAIDPDTQTVQTPTSSISYGHLYNTAGLMADKIAKYCGLGEQYTLLPFKGMYYELSSQCPIAIRHHLYPTPDLNMPFLGVHFTRSLTGRIYIGPSAIPVFGREQYEKLNGIDWGEIPSILLGLSRLYLENPDGFRGYAHAETLRYWKAYFLRAAQTLVPALRSEHLIKSQKVGIRPQLYDKQSKKLAMDFIVERRKHETHILNAISPAFTSAFTFARYVLDNVEVHEEASYATCG